MDAGTGRCFLVSMLRCTAAYCHSERCNSEVSLFLRGSAFFLLAKDERLEWNRNFGRRCEWKREGKPRQTPPLPQDTCDWLRYPRDPAFSSSSNHNDNMNTHCFYHHFYRTCFDILTCCGWYCSPVVSSFRWHTHLRTTESLKQFYSQKGPLWWLPPIPCTAWLLRLMSGVSQVHRLTEHWNKDPVVVSNNSPVYTNTKCW